MTTEKKRILFVDDEPKVLDGLSRMLRSFREEWDVQFATSGEEALEKLESGEYDVLVTDMRMPVMDGAVLLGLVQNRYPKVVRIMFSGHTELQAAFRAVSVAHQFLLIPCDPDSLRNVVRRACNLHSLLMNHGLAGSIGEIDSLPSIPSIYSELTQILSDPEVSIDEIATVVQKDMSMSTKVLQLVNSAFFGIPRRLTSVHDAVGYLGMNIIKSLVFSIEAFKAFEGDYPPGFIIEREQQHGMRIGNLASEFLRDKADKEDAILAGMVHDIGKLVLATRRTDEFGSLLKTSTAENRFMDDVEKETWGVTHAEIGGYLLGLWGLPYSIVEAVAFHHDPDFINAEEFNVITAVWLANALVEEETHPAGSRIDESFLERLGVLNRLNEWRILAAGQAETVI